MPVTAETGTSRHGKTIHYYKCSGRKRNITDCDLMLVRKETLEKIVMDAIINALSKPNTISKIVDHIPKAEIANYYKSALKLEPLLLINYLVDEIILYNDRIEIRFTSPIPKSPDDCQGFLLYSNSTTISCYDKITGIFFDEPFYCIVKL